MTKSKSQETRDLCQGHEDYKIGDFRSQKYQDLDLGCEKRREERKRRRAWQGERREPPSIYLSVCSSQTFADCGQGSRCGGQARCLGRFGPPIVPCAPPCVSLGLKKPRDFIVSEGHGDPLVVTNYTTFFLFSPTSPFPSWVAIVYQLQIIYDFLHAYNLQCNTTPLCSHQFRYSFQLSANLCAYKKNPTQ